MRIEAVGKAFVYQWPGGQVRLEPGKPVDLPDDRAAKLLARAGSRCRIVLEPIAIEVAAPNAKPIFWERGTGEILGPATPEFLAQVGLGVKSTDLWVVADFAGMPVWVRTDRLRTKKQFETQVKPTEVELIKEPR